MLNETALNETIILETFSGVVVPSIAIIVSGAVTIFAAYISVKNNTRNIFIQSNQQKINETIKKLAVGAQREKLNEIELIMNSEDAVYIPNDLRKRIKKEIKKEFNPNFLEKCKKEGRKILKKLKKEEYSSLYDRILNIINRYISP